jgi:glycosyltransferase involved in cell wall biosynthesis
LLKERRPDATLQIASPVSAELRGQLLRRVSPAYRSDVEFMAAGADLPALFAGATVSVLPSMGEPFGMVVLESMASGTPVTGTRDGSLPELISSPGIGRLFDKGENAEVETANAAGLAQALDECIDLAADPATARRCRARACEFGWTVVGWRYEQLLRDFSCERNPLMQTVERA